MKNIRTSAELQVLRNSLNLSDGDLARMFEVNITTIKSWLKPKRYSGGKYYVNFVPEDVIDTLSCLKRKVESKAWDMRDLVEEDFMPFLSDINDEVNDDIYSEPIHLIVYSKEDYNKYTLDYETCPTHKIYFSMIMICKVLLEIPFRYVRVIYFEPNDYFQYIEETDQKDCENTRLLWAYYFSFSLYDKNQNIGDTTKSTSIAINGVIYQKKYSDFIKNKGVGKNDKIACSRASYISYLNSVSHYLNIIISPETLSSTSDMNKILDQLKGKVKDQTINNYRSAMKRYIEMVQENAY